MKENKSGIGLKYALNGLASIFKEEGNFKIHLLCASIVIIAGFILDLSYLEWAVIILTIQAVLLMELVNSVIERTIDYVKPEINEKAKVIKDVSAAIVLVSAIGAVIIGLIIFLPKLI